MPIEVDYFEISCICIYFKYIVHTLRILAAYFYDSIYFDIFSPLSFSTLTTYF